jgi:rhomboid protease GluP
MMGGIVFRFSLTALLTLVNVVVYGYTSFVGGDFLVTDLEVLTRVGQFNLYVIGQGWYWQLFTSMFIHVNMLHLILNMLFLLIFGLRAEEFFNRAEFLFIYLASGLVGNLLTLLLPLLTVSAGASGAIFGIFGATVIYMRKSLGMPIFAALLYSLLFLTLSASEGVNLLAHLGGLAAGLAIGYFIAENRKNSF